VPSKPPYVSPLNLVLVCRKTSNFQFLKIVIKIHNSYFAEITLDYFMFGNKHFFFLFEEPAWISHRFFEKTDQTSTTISCYLRVYFYLAVLRRVSNCELYYLCT